MVDGWGYHHVTGELVNNSNQPASVNQLSGALFDKDGVLITAYASSYVLRYVEAGERAPFTISFTVPESDKEKVDNYEIFINAQVTDPVETYDVTISQDNYTYVDSSNNFHLITAVTNNTDKALSVSLIGSLKDKDGKLQPMPGMGFVSIVCKDVTLRRCAVTVKPGTHRIMSATADASHFGGCKGTVRLEGCRFDGMGDDGVNIKSGLYLTVKERVDDHTVLAAHNLKMADVPDAGDTMEMSHVADLIPYGLATVVKAVNEGGPEGLHRVEFAEALPEALQPGDVLGNATRTPRVRIKDCRIGPNRARGMLLQTRDVVVEGCTFTRCTSAGVLVLTEVVYFFESIGTRNVTIRNNTFIDCNYGAAGAGGALCALAWLKDFAEPPRPGVHRDIAFRNNRVIGTDNCGIYVSGVADITVTGNQIEQAGRKPTGPTGSAAVYIRSSSGIKQERNRIPTDKQGEGFKTAVEYGPGCEGVVEGKRG